MTRNYIGIAFFFLERCFIVQIIYYFLNINLILFNVINPWGAVKDKI